MKKNLGILSILFYIVVGSASVAKATGFTNQDIFELRVYHFRTPQQETVLDDFFKNALLPALHYEGIKKAGVFKAIGNDTTTEKKIYVLIPFKSYDQRQKIIDRLSKSKIYNRAGNAFINAAHDKPAYERLEIIFLKAFEYMPSLAAPLLNAPKNERVYELRSYESASEKILQNKVQMFNQGGEIVLFKRLGFNAVFYGEVITGASMPNLMYMTSFENMKARDEHWKAFSTDPEWKKLSVMKEYQNNVSKIHIQFLTPEAYSDL